MYRGLSHTPKLRVSGISYQKSEIRGMKGDGERKQALVLRRPRSVRASKSICGNIAEGFGKQRRSSAEFKRYLLMAIGSADEMQVWLSYCLDLEYLEQATCAEWRDEYRQ